MFNIQSNLCATATLGTPKKRPLLRRGRYSKGPPIKLVLNWDVWGRLVTGITNDECQKTWGSDRTITSNMLCARDVSSAACHGDSGGKKINTIGIAQTVTSFSQLNFEIFDEKIEKDFLFNSNYFCIVI